MKSKLSRALTFIIHHRTSITAILSVIFGVVSSIVLKKERTVENDLTLSLDEDQAKHMLAHGGAVLFNNVEVRGRVQVRIVKHPEE